MPRSKCTSICGELGRVLKLPAVFKAAAKKSLKIPETENTRYDPIFYCCQKKLNMLNVTLYKKKTNKQKQKNKQTKGQKISARRALQMGL